MDEKAEKPIRTKKKTHKKPGKPLLTKRNVHTALSFVDAGLSVLTYIKPLASYARVLRVATQVGGQVMPEQADPLLVRMKEIRRQIKDLSRTENPADSKQLQVLQYQLDGYLDLFLEQV